MSYALVVAERIQTRNVLVVAVSVALVVAGSAWVAAQPAGAATEQIEAGSNYFCAASFQNGVCTTTITAGDTVTWNMVLGIHTVTECDSTYTTCPVAGGFDSGILEPGETFSETFDAAGVYPYYCAIHPSEMRGVISVVPAATETPAPTPAATETPAPDATDTPAPDVTGGASPTLSPAAVPRSGGGPPADGLPLQALVLAFGGALAVAGAGSLYAARRR